MKNYINYNTSPDVPETLDDIKTGGSTIIKK